MVGLNSIGVRFSQAKPKIIIAVPTAIRAVVHSAGFFLSCINQAAIIPNRNSIIRCAKSQRLKGQAPFGH